MTQPTIGEIDGLPALVVLEGGWRDEYANVIEAHGLAVLSIMVRGGDLSFLSALPKLRGLVLNAGEARDLSPVQALHGAGDADAQHLLQAAHGAGLRRVRRCCERLRMYWNPGFESVFTARRLESLFVFGPPDADLAPLRRLTGLRRLELSQGRKLVSTAGDRPARVPRPLPAGRARRSSCCRRR